MWSTCDLATPSCSFSIQRIFHGDRCCRWSNTHSYAVCHSTTSTFSNAAHKKCKVSPSPLMNSGWQPRPLYRVEDHDDLTPVFTHCAGKLDQQYGKMLLILTCDSIIVIRWLFYCWIDWGSGWVTQDYSSCCKYNIVSPSHGGHYDVTGQWSRSGVCQYYYWGWSWPIEQLFWPCSLSWPA